MARSRPRVESKSCSGWRVTISYVNLICWQGSLRITYAYTCSTSHIYRPLQFKPWDALCPREPSRQRSRQKVITRSTERTAIQHSKFDHCNYTKLRKPLAIDATPAKISAQRMSLASTCTGFQNLALKSHASTTRHPQCCLQAALAGPEMPHPWQTKSTACTLTATGKES